MVPKYFFPGKLRGTVVWLISRRAILVDLSETVDA